MKISVIGMGYVGLSLATLLSTKIEVTAIDILEEKVNMINERISPIKDKDIEIYFKTKKLNLRATTSYEEGLKNSEFIIICVPTNYNNKTKELDTSAIEKIIEKAINMKLESTIIIKSTVPVGYTKKIKEKYNYENIIFSPEFLREGQALHDNLYPSRIIMSSKSKNIETFVNLLKECAIKKNTEILFMNSTEAEAVKLFANAYLAMRVSFFNELDTYAEINDLNTENIIKGISCDYRIGDYYNNPSFGYGGYCLTKDTKQLLTNYTNIPQNLIEAVVKSNETRKEYISNMIAQKNPKVVGIYKLNMKKNSDNYKYSAIFDIMKQLLDKKIKVIIYEPTFKGIKYDNYPVIKGFEEFENMSDIIIANRLDEFITSKSKKVYSRDIFYRD